MSKTSSVAKERWNSNHYTQIKVSVNPETAIAFKEACITNNVSMTSAILQFMVQYSSVTAPKGSYSPELSTKRQRRTAVQKLIRQLIRIRDNEEQYRDNIPTNLQGGSAFDDAEQCISLLDEVLDLLGSAY